MGSLSSFYLVSEGEYPVDTDASLFIVMIVILIVGIAGVVAPFLSQVSSEFFFFFPFFYYSGRGLPLPPVGFGGRGENQSIISNKKS